MTSAAPSAPSVETVSSGLGASRQGRPRVRIRNTTRAWVVMDSRNAHISTPKVAVALRRLLPGLGSQHGVAHQEDGDLRLRIGFQRRQGRLQAIVGPPAARERIIENGEDARPGPSPLEGRGGSCRHTGGVRPWPSGPT